MEDVRTEAAPPTPPNGTLRPVDLRDIDDAIKQLRHERDASGTQTYLLNLVVVAGTGADATPAQAVAAVVSASYPSRTIIVHQEAGSESRLDAALAVPPAGTGGASEQIVLNVYGDAVRQVAVTVSSLLIPDIPVVVWWAGDTPFGLPIFSQLVDIAEQIIVDSGAFLHPLQAWEQMERFIRDEYASVVFTDLSWLRLMSWREMTAQFFDAATTRPYLDNIHGLRVTYAVGDSQSVNPIPALLYGAWLATRLGWELVPNLRRVGRDSLLVLRHRDTPLTIECVGQNAANAANGSVLGVELTAHNMDGTATFALTRTDDPAHIRSTHVMEGQSPEERMLPYEERDSADLLSSQVSAVRRDAVYEDVLDFLAPIASAGGGR